MNNNIEMAGKPNQFPGERGATYSVLTSRTGPLAPKTCSIVGIGGR